MTHCEKNNLTVQQKVKPHSKISLIPRGHFNSYFFCREVMVILFEMKLFFLPWGFSFCCEVNSSTVTVVGHRTFEILFPKILDFSTCGYSWELHVARTSLIWLQSQTKVVETLSEKYPFHSTSEFSMSNFDISTPSPLFNVVTRWKCPWSVLQHWKGGEGGLAINKKDAFRSYGRTPIESVCFAQVCQHFCPWLSEIATQRK